MPDASPEPPKPAPEATASLSSMPLAHQAAFWGFAALLLAALAFYLWWGLSTGVWIDNGVYAVVAVLAGFGLSGMWLMTPNPTRPIPQRP